MIAKLRSCFLWRSVPGSFIINYRRFLAVVLALSVLMVSPIAFANDLAIGRIDGKLVDSETGEPLIGANVFLDGTTLGAANDLDGKFTITKIPSGNYTVVISILGYSLQKMMDVEIVAGKSFSLNLAMTPEALESEEVLVTASLLTNTDAALLQRRQKSIAVSDAISAESISRSASGTAADAMEQVTGASIVDGRYIYVRGLGDRYMNTQLNGSILPSSDPNRNTVSMDLFPAKFIDNIVTTKTFTPDKPGNFTGGSVNITTKSFPERFSMSFSSSASFNTRSSLQRGLSYPGGDSDWLGIDDGTRDIPDALTAPNVVVPNIGEAFTNREKALELDRLSKAFNPVMSVSSKEAPVDQTYAFSVGNQLSLFGKPLGYFVSLSYNRNLSSYDDGVSAQYSLSGRVSEVNELTNLFALRDTKSTDEALWGGLASLSFKPSTNHSFQANFTYNRSGESQARYQTGTMPVNLGPDTRYETRVLKWTERDLRSLQLSGDHYLKSLFNMRVDWASSLTGSKQDEPDLRFFSNDFTTRAREGIETTFYAITISNYPRPARYFRNLDENIWDSYLNLSVPFKQWGGLNSAVKLGGAYGFKDRTFRERRFDYFQSDARYNGNPETFFALENVGIVDSTSSRFFRFGNYIVDATQPSSNYDGEQDVYAGYGMIDLPLFRRLRLITGLRYETTRIDVVSKDPNKEKGDLSTNDILPSVNLVYQIGENMNIRGAYGRTLARPTFRELAPFASFDFLGDFIFIGNPNLERTLVDNFDLRWEWFSRPGEIFAASAFYKNFENPIERAIVSQNNQGQFQNVKNARVIGLEFELRKRLEQIHPVLSNFQLGGNFSLIDSEVDIPQKELQAILAYDPNASRQRPLQGQSPYVLNVDFGYDNSQTGTTISLFYNLFGKRLAEVSLGGTPNVFEQARGTLDLTLSQRIWRSLTLKASAKNLLDTSIRKAHTFKDQDFVVAEYKIGRTFSFGTTLNID